MSKLLVAAVLAAFALPAAAAESPAGQPAKVEKVQQQAKPQPPAAPKKPQGKKAHPPKHDAEVAPKG